MSCVPNLCQQPVSGGPGQRGPGGDSVSAPPPTAIDGADGKLTAGQTFYTAFVGILNPYYSSILLHQAEDFYINGDIPNTTARLLWLKGLLEARVENTNQLSAADLKTYETHRYRADALLNQISLSLDYYGEFTNSVPLLTVEAIIGELDSLMSYGQTVESAYNTFQNALAQKTIDQASLNATRTNLLQQNGNLQNSLTDNVKQRTDLENNVAALNQQLQNLWSQMAQAERDFQTAVVQTSNGCNFGQVLSIAAMVATVVASGGTAAAAVGPALAALQGQQQKNGQTVPVPDTLEGFNYEVNTVVTLGKDVNNFTDAFNKVKSSIGQPAGPNLLPPPPNDETKILAQAKDIDAELDKYRNLPTAQAYKALIDNFVATAQAKNNMILQVNALYAAWDNINSQISQNASDAIAIQDQISDVTDPRLAPAVLFLESAYRQAINGITFALYSVYRAYTYYSLDQTSFSVDATNIATLGNAKSTIVERYYNALAASGAAPTPFTIAVDIVPYLPPGALQSFAAGATLSFSLPPDATEFKAVSQAMINKIAVKFAKSTGPLAAFSVNFTQHGHSMMLDASGGQHMFLHTPINVPYGVDATGNPTITGDFSGQLTAPPASLSGGPLYSGVSPYGPWTINISAMDAKQRSTITSVTVVFSGSARGRNAT
jgi:hypothetical protein